MIKRISHNVALG